jgi:hypothetical protein
MTDVFIADAVGTPIGRFHQDGGVAVVVERV